MPGCNSQYLTISLPSGVGCFGSGGAITLGQAGNCCEWDGAGFHLALSSDGPTYTWTLTYGACTWTASGSSVPSLPATLTGGGGSVILSGATPTLDPTGGPKFKFPVAGTSEKPECCCCGTGTPPGTTCCAGTCVGYFLALGGNVTTLTANSENGQGGVCNWSDGTNSVVWNSFTETWTLVTASGVYVAQAGCSFPVTIGPGTVFPTCDWWTAEPPTVTLTISGIPDPWNHLVNCPATLPNACYTLCPRPKGEGSPGGTCYSMYWQLNGTSACNGTFVLDQPGTIGCGCCWSYEETLSLSSCAADYCNSCASGCSPDSCQYVMYAKLNPFPGGKYEFIVYLQLTDLTYNRGVVFSAVASVLVPASEICYSFSCQLSAVAATFDLVSLTTSTVNPTATLTV